MKKTNSYLCLFMFSYLIWAIDSSDRWEIQYRRNYLNASHQIQLANYERERVVNATDKENCFKLSVDKTGNINLRLSCCISKGYMHKPESLVSVDPNRCQILVCEQMIESDPYSVEIVTKSPVFVHSEAMTGCCFRSGVMYKPGATFSENGRFLTCCMGNIYANLDEDDSSEVKKGSRTESTREPISSSTGAKTRAFKVQSTIPTTPVQVGNRCPSYKCAPRRDFHCSDSSSQRFDLRQTQYAIFPTVLSDKGFSMNVFGAKDSMNRDCRGNFYLASNVKPLEGSFGVSKESFLGLQKKYEIQGFFVKFTSQFKQSWAVMIDIQGMNNPIIKDLAINSIGDVYALIAYESSSSGKKITAIAKYDSCGIFVSYVDVLEGTFVSRDAYISIDSQDNALIVNSNVASFSEHPCRIYSSRASSDFRPLWNVTIRREGVSCLPTGIVTDCEDHVYVSGFFGSDGGFVKKLNKSTGAAIWSLEDDLLQGQITDLVHDVASAEIIVVVNNAHLHRVKSSDGSILKSAEILVKKFTILPSGEILAFVFTLEDRSHRLVMLNYDLQTERVYSIPWNDWNSIAWCDNLVEDVDGRAVFLSCAMNPTHDIIIFRIEV